MEDLCRDSNLVSPELVDVVEGLAERRHFGSFVVLIDVVSGLTADFDADAFLNVTDADAADDIAAFDNTSIDALACDKSYQSLDHRYLI